MQRKLRFCVDPEGAILGGQSRARYAGLGCLRIHLHLSMLAHTAVLNIGPWCLCVRPHWTLVRTGSNAGVLHAGLVAPYCLRLPLVARTACCMAYVSLSRFVMKVFLDPPSAQPVQCLSCTEIMAGLENCVSYDCLIYAGR